MIPHIPTERTKYSDDQTLEILRTGDQTTLNVYCDYVLWDCSTEFMINNGMPTDADVQEWIKVLEARTDIDTERYLRYCREYITPLP